MIPVIGSDGWFLMPLRPTPQTPAKLAKLRIVDGHIVQAFTRERAAGRAPWNLHWAEGRETWTETA